MYNPQLTAIGSNAAAHSHLDNKVSDASLSSNKGNQSHWFPIKALLFKDEKHQSGRTTVFGTTVVHILDSCNTESL